MIMRLLFIGMAAGFAFLASTLNIALWWNGIGSVWLVWGALGCMLGCVVTALIWPFKPSKVRN